MSNSSWPIRTLPFETSEDLKPVQVNVTRSANKEDILYRFSNLSRAYHVLAYVFRFFLLTNKKKSKFCKFESLRIGAKELIFIRNRLFYLSQQRHFLNVLLSYNDRHPIILPYGCRLSRLYVEFIHKLTFHGGHRLVLNMVRQECWIIRAKTLIKTVIHNCKTCVLYQKKTQIMSVLPKEWTTITRPFTNTGIDFAGPFEIKSFTCICSFVSLQRPYTLRLLVIFRHPPF